MAVSEYGSMLTTWFGEQQTVIGQMVSAATLGVLPAWDTSSLAAVDATWPPVEQALINAVNEAYGLSSAVAVDYYELFRAAEQAAGTATPLLAEPLPEEQLVTSLRVTGPVVARQLVTAEDRQVIEKLLQSLLGSTSRLALNGGRNTIERSGTADAELLGWARVCHSKRPCAFCRMLRSRGPVYTKQTGGFKAHDHCVVGSTLVSGPPVEAAYRRWYQGELIVVRSSAGDELAVTPNHPVLTDRGWVDAGLLREGDNLVHRTGAKSLMPGVPNEDHVPAPIEDAWRTHGVYGLRPVPVAAEDFHGDGVGTQGYVHVVAPHGRFPVELDSPAAQLGAQRFGSLAGLPAVPNRGLGLRDLLEVLVGAGSASDGVMGGSRLGRALFRGERRSVQGVRIADTASLHASFEQPPSNDGACYAEVLRQALLGDSSGVALDQIRRGGQFQGARSPQLRPRFDPPPLEAHAERPGVHADLGCGLLERLAGQVELRSLVELRRVDFSGHVFNLRTSEGWYDASSLVVSNCRCTAEPVYSTASRWPDGAETDRALWNEVTKGYSGNDALNAFRRAVYAGR